jgi:hypothetical protein
MQSLKEDLVLGWIGKRIIRKGPWSLPCLLCSHYRSGWPALGSLFRSSVPTPWDPHQSQIQRRGNMEGASKDIFCLMSPGGPTVGFLLGTKDRYRKVPNANEPSLRNNSPFTNIIQKKVQSNYCWVFSKISIESRLVPKFSFPTKVTSKSIIIFIL